MANSTKTGRMISERHFRVWNIFDSALNRHSTGHHYWETKALADELLSRGQTVRLFTHRDAPAIARFPGVEIVPTFSLNPYDFMSTDPVWSTIENFIVHSRSFHSDLASLDLSLFRDSAALFPTVMENQLLGLFRWLSGLSPETRPSTAVCVMWSESKQCSRMHQKLWKECPQTLRDKIAIFCRTPQMAEMYANLVGLPARAFPFPASMDLVTSKPRRNKETDMPLAISFVGGARRERGGELIAEVVNQCAGPGIRFFIQIRHEHTDGPDAAPGSTHWRSPNVQIHEGALGRDEYYAAITGHVVLLPYQPGAYRWRDSGVYQEAKLLAAPVLVTAGTWMAEEVKRLGNGLVIEKLAVASIIECIKQAQRELPTLRAAAGRVAQESSRTQGVARCIDAIQGAFDGR